MDTNQSLQGIIITSLDSGILLFSQEYVKNFGMTENIDAMQQSSTLFALYKMSCSEIDDKDFCKGNLKWIKKVYYHPVRMILL